MGGVGKGDPFPQKMRPLQSFLPHVSLSQLLGTTGTVAMWGKWCLWILSETAGRKGRGRVALGTALVKLPSYQLNSAAGTDWITRAAVTWI